MKNSGSYTRVITVLKIVYKGELRHNRTEKGQQNRWMITAMTMKTKIGRFVNNWNTLSILCFDRGDRLKLLGVSIVARMKILVNRHGWLDYGISFLGCHISGWLNSPAVEWSSHCPAIFYVHQHRPLIKLTHHVTRIIIYPVQLGIRRTKTCIVKREWIHQVLLICSALESKPTE